MQHEERANIFFIEMIFVKTFKGYEDKVQMLDEEVNRWVQQNNAQVVSVQTALSQAMPMVPPCSFTTMHMCVFRARSSRMSFTTDMLSGT